MFSVVVPIIDMDDNDSEDDTEAIVDATLLVSGVSFIICC
jgi:hypothetical protein